MGPVKVVLMGIGKGKQKVNGKAIQKVILMAEKRAEM
jgi:hypothetical protein